MRAESLTVWTDSRRLYTNEYELSGKRQSLEI